MKRGCVQEGVIRPGQDRRGTIGARKLNPFASASKLPETLSGQRIVIVLRALSYCHPLRLRYAT